MRLTTLNESPNTLNEIARLRELTFKRVGEGTGGLLDIDKFDEHYHHLILWDPKEIEIVGAYRIGIGKDILKDHNIDGFYTSTLFDFTDTFIAGYLPFAFEMGRSFIQPKYWRTNALESLWHGVGAIVKLNPEVRYLFGAVSISGIYKEEAKNAIIYFYKKWFSSKYDLAKSKNRFIIPGKSLEDFQNILTGDTQKEDYLILKSILKPMGHSIPVLFKQYTDLCDNGGVQFLDFGIDELFGGCVDGLILVDLNYVKKDKLERYSKTN